MDTMKMGIRLGLICLLVVTNSVMSQDNGTVNDQTDGKALRPIDEGMQPLYTMTTIFLDLVQPSQRGHILQKIDFKSLIGGEIDANSYLTEEYSSLALHYIGYAVCIAVGLLFIIIFPIVGCCFCCCRCCCGYCGGKQDPRESKKHRCLSITCGLMLFMLNTIMLIGMVCGFVTNELIREQTSQEKDLGLLPKVLHNIDRLDNYKEATFSELKSTVVVGAETEINKLLAMLDTAPHKAKIELGEITDSTAMLRAASNLAQSALTINSSLANVERLTNTLQRLQVTLGNQLDEVQIDISTTLNGINPCPSDCESLKDELSNLDMSADFNQLDSVQAELEKVRSVVDSDLVGLVQEGDDEFERVIDKVGNQTEEKVADVRKETDAVLKEVRNKTNQVIKKVNEMVPFNQTKQQVKGYMTQVDQFGTYRWYAGLGLSCVLLLIVLFYYLGLLFGVVGEPPDEAAQTCNKGVGANLLMAGVGFTFIFCWLLMLVTMIFFLIGGFTHTEVCRHITDIDSNEDGVIDQLLGQYLNGSIEIKLSNVLKGCKEGNALFEVIDINSFVNLSEVLDLENFGVKEKMDELKDINVDLSDINIVSDDLQTQLDELSAANLDDIQFNIFKEQIDKQITKIDLKGYVTSLKNFGEAVGGSIKTDLDGHAETLTSIETSTVTNMKDLKNDLDTYLTSLQNEVQGEDESKSFATYVQDIKTELMKSEEYVHINGTSIIKEFIADFALTLYNSLDAYLTRVQNEIEHNTGRCGPVYEALDSTIDAACIHFLYPFNGFWFCFGWFIFFSIPCLIVAVKLAGLYRKTEEYDYSDNKSFDDPRNYDAYVGVYPGDNIPLEDIHRRKKQHQQPPQQGNGLQNTGYDNRTDDYTNSRHGAPYQRGHDYRQLDNGYSQQARAHPQSNGGYLSGQRDGYDQGSYPLQSTNNPPNPPHYYNNRHY